MKALIPFIKFFNPWPVLVYDWNLSNGSSVIIDNFKEMIDKHGTKYSFVIMENIVLRNTINELSEKSGIRKALLRDIFWIWAVTCVNDDKTDCRQEIVEELAKVLDNRELAELTFTLLAR